MIRFFNSGQSPIGIDVTGRSLYAVQLKKCGKTWQVCAVASYDRPDDQSPLTAEETHVFAEMLDRQGFVGNEVVLSVPSELLMSDLLEFPRTSNQVSSQQLARMELARTSKCSPGDFEMTSWSLPSPARAGETMHVMAAGCRHEDSETLMKNWDLAGMEVVALDVQSQAIARACQPMVASVKGISALIKFGWRAAQLVVMYQGAVVYERALSESGMGELNRTLMQRLDIDRDVADFAMFDVGFTTEMKDSWKDWPLLTDARGIIATHFTSLLDEVRVSFSYAQHRYPDTSVNKLFLTGRGASIPGLQEPISEMLEIDSVRLSPAQLVDCPERILELCDNPALTVAIGLAQFDG